MQLQLFLNTRPRRFTPETYNLPHRAAEPEIIQQLNRRIAHERFIAETEHKARLFEKFKLAQEDLYAQTMREQQRLWARYKSQEKMCQLQKVKTERKIQDYSAQLKEYMLEHVQLEAHKLAAEETTALREQIQEQN